MVVEDQTAICELIIEMLEARGAYRVLGSTADGMAASFPQIPSSIANEKQITDAVRAEILAATETFNASWN